MKKFSFLFLFLFGLMSLQTATAQVANNFSGDDWIVSYQGAETPVPAGATNVPITLGTDPNQAIGVYTNSSGFCGNKFFFTGIWNATCTLNTNFDFYQQLPVIYPPNIVVFTFF